MLNLDRSQLFPPCTHYISQKDLTTQSRPPSNRSSDNDRLICFYVKQQNHYASVRIQRSHFQIDSHPEQQFYSVVARYKLCCSVARPNDFRQTLRATAHNVYASTFKLQDWNFESDHCWVADGHGEPSNEITTCLGSAVSILEQYIDINRADPILSPGTGGDPSSGKKRIGETIARSHKAVKKFRSSEQQITHDNQCRGNGEVLGAELTDILTLAKQIDKEDVLESVARLLRLEGQALQMRYFCQYLSTCLYRLYTTSLGLGKRKAQTQLNLLLIENNLATSPTECVRRASEARTINQIIASMPNGTIGEDLLVLLFQDNVFAMLRAACRKNQQEMDSFVYTVLEEFSKLNRRSTGRSVNVVELFGTRFKDLTHQQVSTSIGFQPVLFPSTSSTSSTSSDDTDVEPDLMQEHEQIGSTTTSIDAQSTYEDYPFPDIMDAASVLQSLQHDTHGHTRFAAIETCQQLNSSYPMLSLVGQSSCLFPDLENQTQPLPNTSGTSEHASAWTEASTTTVSNDDERPSLLVADMRIGGERLGDLNIFNAYH